MSGFFSGLWLGVKTLVSDPIGYMTDPIGATTKKYESELAAAGLSQSEISERVSAYQDSGGLVYSTYSGLGKLSKGIQGILKFTLENLPAIILVVALAFAAWWVIRILKVMK